MKTKKRNENNLIKEARAGIPFLASYKEQDYIVVDVVEVKNRETREWEICYMYKTIGKSDRLFAREIKEFNQLFKRDGKTT